MREEGREGMGTEIERRSISDSESRKGKIKGGTGTREGKRKEGKELQEERSNMKRGN